MRYGLTALLWLVLTLAAGRAEAAPRVFAPGLRAERAIDDGLVRLLDELMLTELARSGRLSVVGKSDVRQLIEHEREKYALGCTDDSCLAELGGALGADYLAAASLGRVGEHAYLLNLKLIDVHSMRAVRRWSREVRGEEDDLLAALREGVAAVCDLSGRGVEQREVSPWTWAMVGAGAAFLVGGAVAHGLNVTDFRRLDRMKSSDSGRRALRQRVDIEAGLAIGGYVAGGLVLAAGLTWLLWPEPDAEGDGEGGTARLRLHVLPTIGPGSVGVQGRW